MSPTLINMKFLFIIFIFIAVSILSLLWETAHAPLIDDHETIISSDKKEKKQISEMILKKTEKLKEVEK